MLVEMRIDAHHYQKAKQSQQLQTGEMVSEMKALFHYLLFVSFAQR